jgi:hypothetical protein
METFRLFDNLQSARDYRYINGTGGWIFEPDNGEKCILFPPEYPPIAIFNHQLTRGKCGKLICNN